jgi:hypothetical protein
MTSLRAFSTTCLLLALSLTGQADPLTEADREMLIEKLEKIQNAADQKLDQRFHVAASAFRAAMASDEATMELYLKCVEKIEYQDEHKKQQEFREWKRKEADKLNSLAFRRALRHQLRWLVLTLQAASKGSDITELSTDAMRLTGDVVGDIRRLGGQQNVLRQNVTSSVFAEAYNLGDVVIKDWPLSPVDLNSIYDKVVLPPLRVPERVDSLRGAWMKRIQQEVAIREEWPKQEVQDTQDEEKDSKSIGTKEALRPPEVEKFLADGYPDLLWQMEVDVFKAGDQRGASLRMFQHLEKYVAHRRASQWAQQFRALLQPEATVSLPADAPQPPPNPTPPAPVTPSQP